MNKANTKKKNLGNGGRRQLDGRRNPSILRPVRGSHGSERRRPTAQSGNRETLAIVGEEGIGGGSEGAGEETGGREECSSNPHLHPAMAAVALEPKRAGQFWWGGLSPSSTSVRVESRVFLPEMESIL